MVSEAEYRQAVEAGQEYAKATPGVVAAGYDATTGRVTVELTNGARFEFPARKIQGLQDATDAQLAKVERMGRYALCWEELNADILVPELMAGIFGTRAFMAAQAGRVTSPAKAAASRRNGIKGGRPRKAA
ncbi:DUF2442 domain-containing protein [Asaia sp. VD9]|uniref:DUF2442 domain-containing protein n=1 Tax=Asaia sp. VD9 TaxID=3081235 RepID=UPI0030174FCE